MDGFELAIKMHKVAMQLSKKADKALLERAGMSFPQFMVMASVANKHQCNQAEVAHMRELTQAAVSRMIDGLLEKEWLTRKENPENRREHILELTTIGEKEMEKALVIVKENIGEVFGKLTEQDMANFSLILDKLLNFIYTNPEKIYA